MKLRMLNQAVPYIFFAIVVTVSSTAWSQVNPPSNEPATDSKPPKDEASPPSEATKKSTSTSDAPPVDPVAPGGMMLSKEERAVTLAKKVAEYASSG